MAAIMPEQTTPERTIPERPPRRSLVGPAILIALGLVLLLNNIGVLNWDVWSTLLRLWPVLLIAAGLDMLIGRRSAWVSLLIALLLLVVMGVAIVLPGTWLSFGAAPTITTISQPLDGAQRAEVELQIGVGALDLRAMNTPDGLVAGTVQLRSGARLIRDFAVTNGTAHYTLREEGAGVFGWQQRGGDARWQLRLNPDVPTSLRLSAGVGTATADLSQLTITDLEVSTGVGQTIITLPARGDFTATVSGGVGETIVIVPRGLAAQIEASRGIGAVNISGNYQRSDNTYTTPDYASAQNRVRLEISGGVGQITVREP